MKELKLADNKSALVIVAHPDDETIWMGGVLQRFPNARWTIFSLCRESDDDRQPKFFRVCELYGAKAIITDLEDEDKLSVAETIPIIKKYVKEKVKGRCFDYLFTHGANGEYGHPRHSGTYQAVREMLENNEIKADRVFYFNYKKIGEKKMKMKNDSDYNLKLTKEEFKEKKRIVAEMYGYALNGIDVGLCAKMEGFKKF